MYSELPSIAELSRVVQKLKAEGKTVVLCHGVWDLLHPGHHAHLRAAKAECDVLMVTVTPDKYVDKGPERPAFNELLRANCLFDLEFVDYVAINEWPNAVETIKTLKPDVYAKGSDYSDSSEDVTGAITQEREAIEAIGGRIHFTNETSFSSTKLLNRYFSPYPESARGFLEGFRQRYNAEEVVWALKELRRLKVLVIGDAIIDEYCYCQGLGKTPKDNIIAVKYLYEETFAGGVLAAVNHIAGFCATVDLVTCLGKQNNYEQFILSHLKPNVKVKLFYHDDAPTIVKRRFVDPTFLTKMFEIAHLDDDLPQSLHEKICSYLASVIKGYDLILATDFGHGMIDKDTAEYLSSADFLAVNTQANSANAGFNVITKYQKAHYICLDEPELRLACRDKFSDPQHLVENISRQLDCPILAITQGHRGSLTCEEGKFYAIPALTGQAVDRMGAGDAFLAITAPCVALGFDMELVGFLGNSAAALKLQIVGNREAVEPVSLFKFITALLK